MSKKLNKVGDVIIGLTVGHEYETKKRDPNDGRFWVTYSNTQEIDDIGEWLVVKAKMDGGSHDRLSTDYWPDVWQLTLQKLRADGTVGPKAKKPNRKLKSVPVGYRLKASQRSNYHGEIPYYKPVRKLVRKIVWEKP